METKVGGQLPGLSVFNPDGTPVEISVTDGRLPDVVNLNTDGSFRGAPTTVGAYKATVEVCNTAAGLCTTTVLNITVASAAGGSLPTTGPVAEGLWTLALTLAGVGVGFLFLGRRPRGRRSH